MKKTGILSIIIFFFLSFFSLEVSANTFPDLPKWAEKEILYLYNEKIVNGKPNGTFGSTQNIKRGDAALMLARAKGLESTSNAASPFSDVQDKEKYYYDAILAAAEAGYINGYPDETFRPEATLTRAEMAKVVSEAFGYESNGGNYFNDVTETWMKDSVEALVVNGISEGYGDGTFKPNKNISRAEFSVMMARALDDGFKLKPEMEVHFIDVGQGDSILIQTPDGANILIDAGIQSAGEKVVSFLKSKDVGKLDLVVATHPHADHIGGLIPVLNAFKVDKFVDSGNAHTTQTYIDLLTIIDKKDIPFEIPSIGQVYHFDNDFKMTVLHVDSNAIDLNDASMVIKADYHHVSFMLTGDAEQDIENSLTASSFDLKSTILKAGHHGSHTSSTQAFLNVVKPDATILSYGKGNSYGHPHIDAVNRLRQVGSDIYSTAASGDITVKTNGQSYSITAEPWSPPAPKPEPNPEPKPTPKPQPKPEPKPTPDLSTGTYVIPGAPTSFKNCTELRTYYPYGVRESHPAYAKKHDRDNDKWACER